jgi:hypothetical protein
LYENREHLDINPTPRVFTYTDKVYILLELSGDTLMMMVSTAETCWLLAIWNIVNSKKKKKQETYYVSVGSHFWLFLVRYMLCTNKQLINTVTNNG